MPREEVMLLACAAREAWDEAEMRKIMDKFRNAVRDANRAYHEQMKELAAKARA